MRKQLKLHDSRPLDVLIADLVRFGDFSLHHPGTPDPRDHEITKFLRFTVEGPDMPPQAVVDQRKRHDLAFGLAAGDTTLRIVTPVQTLDLPARSFNEGLPSVTAEVLDSAPAKIALISMLGAPTDRFAVDVNGESSVFPWADAVSQALIACR